MQAHDILGIRKCCSTTVVPSLPRAEVINKYGLWAAVVAQL